MPDGRKNNGGKSTKSKKPIDRRKRMSFENPEQFEFFFEQIKVQMYHFYESVRKDFLDKHIRHGLYYVYLHKIEKEVVYVGKGKGERAMHWASRDEEHGELMVNGHINIEIVANSLTEPNALLIEAALIKDLKPKYNVR